MWIVIVVIAILLFMLIYYFNKFVILSNRIDNSLAQIDVQLKKRADLVPNLVEAVKGYMKHERGVFSDIAKARAAMLSAPDLAGRVKAGNELQNALKSIFALSERYPKLKANENFLQLQQELSAIEDKVAYSRQYYNDNLLSYNTSCTTFPGNLFAGIFGRNVKPYLEIPLEEKAVPKVSF
jgi:LemA protein